MSKRTKIIYWIATCWLALGMSSSAITQLIRLPEEVEKTSVGLGYPEYFLTIIGLWKLAGVLAVLVPKYPLVKEWAYAGFFFLTTGALASHFAAGDALLESFGASLLLVLTVVSWYFRPDSRKLVLQNK
jgi:hypothetical protein